MKKENKGITLVALVITIIVLIILAGVSIYAVMNDGLIDNAKTAKNEWNEAKAEETNELVEYEIETDFAVQSPYTYKTKYITGVEVIDKKAETVKSFRSKLAEGYEVYTKTEGTIDSATAETMLMSTGMIIKSVEDNKEIGKIVIYGDINGDGKIDSVDRTILVGILAQKFQPSEAQKIASDINHDGVVDENDRDLLAGIVNGSIIDYKIEQNVEAKIPEVIVNTTTE